MVGRSEQVENNHLELLARADFLEAQIQDLTEMVMALEDEGLRREIARNLSFDGVDAGQHRIVMFQVPASAGGHLELVRQVVLEAQQMVTNAGMSPHPSVLQEIALGDTYYGAGSFRQAFDHYRNGYRALAY